MMTIGCAPVLAADPLGLYIGAGAGHSQVRIDLDFGVFGTPGISGPLDVTPGATGWKLIAGIRPLSVIGAEVEYIDFGSAGATAGPAAQAAYFGAATTSHPKSPALFAIGYLPIPLPYLDVFAKAGVARLKTDVQAQFVCLPSAGGCPPLPFIPPYSASGTDTRFAYGAGVQVKLSKLAVRAEYERISSAGGDLDLLSLGVIFVF
jgi:opacity protein-like surface antigen